MDFSASSGKACEWGKGRGPKLPDGQWCLGLRVPFLWFDNTLVVPEVPWFWFSSQGPASGAGRSNLRPNSYILARWLQPGPGPGTNALGIRSVEILSNSASQHLLLAFFQFQQCQCQTTCGTKTTRVNPKQLLDWQIVKRNKPNQTVNLTRHEWIIHGTCGM